METKKLLNKIINETDKSSHGLLCTLNNYGIKYSKPKRYRDKSVLYTDIGKITFNYDKLNDNVNLINFEPKQMKEKIVIVLFPSENSIGIYKGYPAKETIKKFNVSSSTLKKISSLCKKLNFKLEEGMFCDYYIKEMNSNSINKFLSWFIGIIEQDEKEFVFHVTWFNEHGIFSKNQLGLFNNKKFETFKEERY